MIHRDEHALLGNVNVQENQNHDWRYNGYFVLLYDYLDNDGHHRDEHDPAKVLLLSPTRLCVVFVGRPEGNKARHRYVENADGIGDCPKLGDVEFAPMAGLELVKPSYAV